MICTKCKKDGELKIFDTFQYYYCKTCNDEIVLDSAPPSFSGSPGYVTEDQLLAAFDEMVNMPPWDNNGNVFLCRSNFISQPGHYYFNFKYYDNFIETVRLDDYIFSSNYVYISSSGYLKGSSYKDLAFFPRTHDEYQKELLNIHI